MLEMTSKIKKNKLGETENFARSVGVAYFLFLLGLHINENVGNNFKH